MSYFSDNNVDLFREVVEESIEKLTNKYQNSSRPIRFSFRDTISRWISRSDKYTHQIHSYPAKLIAYIPIFFQSHPSYGKRRKYLLDPFAGTGTVLLEGIIHPFHPMNTLGVEINPLARLVSKVKITPLDPEDLALAAEDLLAAIKRSRIQSGLPELFNIDFWFKPKAQWGLARIKHQIECLTDPDHKDFFLVCLSSIIRRASLADKKIGPPVLLKKIKYSTDTHTRSVIRELREKHNPDPIKYFQEEVEANIIRMAGLYDTLNNGKLKSQIIWDDVRTLRKGKYTGVGQIDKYRARRLPLVDLVITSPPYINAQKYIRTLKFEMVLLGLVPYEELMELDQTLVGTERIYEKDYLDLYQVGDKLADTTIERIYKKDRKRAAVVGRFYQDMTQALLNIHEVMRPGGRFVLVIGNNLVFNRRVQNHQILANIARDQIGFHVDFIARDEIRSRGLITKRHETSGIIGDEWVLSLSKN
jgi:hypothetical protein